MCQWRAASWEFPHGGSTFLVRLVSRRVELAIKFVDRPHNWPTLDWLSRGARGARGDLTRGQSPRDGLSTAPCPSRHLAIGHRLSLAFLYLINRDNKLTWININMDIYIRNRVSPQIGFTIEITFKLFFIKISAYSENTVYSQRESMFNKQDGRKSQ